MKRYGNLFHKIYDIDNIRLAHKNASKGKGSYRDVIMVNKHPEKYFKEIQSLLVDKKFINSKYKIEHKNDKGKLREICKLPYYPDRIIHHSIMQILEPIWKSSLIADTYQSIKGRGVHKAKRKIEKHLANYTPEYCLKIDIKKFYPSIDNSIMKSTIRRKIKCKYTLWLLDEIIDSIKGLPIGNYLSQYFGNIYLSRMDHILKENLKVKSYFRYCDDVVIMHSNKKFLHYCLYVIKKVCKDIKLEIKSNYQVFKTFKRGLDFLGFRFFRFYVLLRKKIATGFKRATKNNSIDSISSYYGWIKSCSAYNLWIYGKIILSKQQKGVI